jgi:hypothetical protein
MDRTIHSDESGREVAQSTARESGMKDSKSSGKLLDLPYFPEADEYLDELERSGQFRIGIDAENDDGDSGASAASNDYSWGRGSGNVSIQDWWTTGRVALRIGPDIDPNDLTLMRVNDALLVRTRDGLDRVVLEGYLGLIPDASTLRSVFNDGSEWTGGTLTSRITGWLVAADASQNSNTPTN